MEEEGLDRGGGGRESDGRWANILFFPKIVEHDKKKF